MTAMKHAVLVVFFSMLSAKSFSQSQEAEIRATIDKMFEAMRTADTNLLKQVVSSDAILQTVVSGKGGNAHHTQTQTVASFLEAVGRGKSGDADERIRFESIQIDGPLASVWTSYRFFYKGNFSHCGVNAFQLVRREKGWTIQYIIDTRRKDKCIW